VVFTKEALDEFLGVPAETAEEPVSERSERTNKQSSTAADAAAERSEGRA
jgi:hypothetical protein